MKFFYILLNAVLSLLGIGVLWVCTFFSLASDDYFQKNIKPHLTQYILIRFLADLVVVALMLLVLLLINHLFIQFSKDLPKGILKRTIFTQAIVFLIAAAVWVAYLGYDISGR